MAFVDNFAFTNDEIFSSSLGSRFILSDLSFTIGASVEVGDFDDSFFDSFWMSEYLLSLFLSPWPVPVSLVRYIFLDERERERGMGVFREFFAVKVTRIEGG